MKLKGITTLKSLLANYHQREELFSLLPTDLSKQIQKLPPAQITSLSPMLRIEKCLETIHYSWFSGPFEHLPTQTRSYLLALFPPRQAQGLSNLLRTPIAPKVPLYFLRPFLANYIKMMVQGDSILDEELLPSSEMNVLLKITKTQLVHLIDLLGIHDLAADLRQIVNNEVLQRIHAALTKEQLQFLQYCGRQPLRWVSPKLNLELWNGDHKKLNSILHQRGLARLAKGVIEEDPSLQWHLVHRLDSGRGKILLKVSAQKYDREMVSYFKAQILHIIKRYQ